MFSITGILNTGIKNITLEGYINSTPSSAAIPFPNTVTIMGTLTTGMNKNVLNGSIDTTPYIIWNENDIFLFSDGICKIYSDSLILKDTIEIGVLNTKVYKVFAINKSKTKLYCLNIDSSIDIYDFNMPHSLLSTVDLSNYGYSPTAICFKNDDSYLISFATTPNIFNLDTNNNLIATYIVQTSDSYVGIAGMSLASNQTTIYYTTTDTLKLKLYDTVLGQLEDFPTNLYCADIKLIPPYDGSNGILVSSLLYGVSRLSSTGAIIKNYAVENNLYGYWNYICLDNDGSSLLALDLYSGVYKFDITTGNILKNSDVGYSPTGITTYPPSAFIVPIINPISNISLQLHNDNTITVKFKSESVNSIIYNLERKLLTDSKYTFVNSYTCSAGYVGFVQIADNEVDITSNKYQYRISYLNG